MSKHTPGPWEAKGWRVCANLAEGGPPLTVICDTANNKASRTPENEANARLIAAAPDLLVACKMLVDSPGITAAENEVLKSAIERAGIDQPPQKGGTP